MIAKKSSAWLLFHFNVRLCCETCDCLLYSWSWTNQRHLQIDRLSQSVLLNALWFVYLKRVILFYSIHPWHTNECQFNNNIQFNALGVHFVPNVVVYWFIGRQFVSQCRQVVDRALNDWMQGERNRPGLDNVTIDASGPCQVEWPFVMLISP